MLLWVRGRVSRETLWREIFRKSSRRRFRKKEEKDGNTCDVRPKFTLAPSGQELSGITRKEEVPRGKETKAVSSEAQSERKREERTNSKIERGRIRGLGGPSD